MDHFHRKTNKNARQVPNVPDRILDFGNADHLGFWGRGCARIYSRNNRRTRVPRHHSTSPAMTEVKTSRGLLKLDDKALFRNRAIQK